MVFIFRSLNLYKQKFIRQYRHLVEKFGALHNEFPSSLNLQHFLIKQNLKYTLNDANLNLLTFIHTCYTSLLDLLVINQPLFMQRQRIMIIFMTNLLGVSRLICEFLSPLNVNDKKNNGPRAQL